MPFDGPLAGTARLRTAEITAPPSSLLAEALRATDTAAAARAVGTSPSAALTNARPPTIADL